MAAVELVSPANKDRPEHRSQFTSKCTALLRQGVSLVLVDVVTSRNVNLYAELLELIGQWDPSLGEHPPATYAVTCRWGIPWSVVLLASQKERCGEVRIDYVQHALSAMLQYDSLRFNSN